MQNITEINLNSPIEPSSPAIKIIKTETNNIKKPNLSVVNSINGQQRKIVPLEGLELLTDKKKIMKDSVSFDNRSNLSNFSSKNMNTGNNIFKKSNINYTNEKKKKCIGIFK